MENKTKNNNNENNQIINNKSKNNKNNGILTKRKHKNAVFISTKREYRKHKNFYNIVFASLAALFVLSIVFISLDQGIGIINETQTNDAGWPKQVFAPFADMTSWVDTSNAYSINGVADLGQVQNETEINYFNLGFINPSQTNPLDQDGNINWRWGGYNSITENGADAYQYAGIISVMDEIRANGGDFAISFGGQYGKAPWVITQNEEKLKDMYVDVINKYDCKRIDLDIEESNQGEAENRANARAVAAAQTETGVSVTLTIPIMPSGWEEKQTKLIKAYLDAGVDIALINSMTMCYGAGLYEGEDYGDASIRAIENSINQMQSIYSNYGINLTTAQAYSKTGATVCIGYESSYFPTFTTAMAKKVADHAKANNYGMLSYWSINRDALMEYNRAINTLYSYYNVMK
ncbi:MAG: hypothetical protein K6F08_02520 [bacterium]|nr:hypothetical protein [bacterium]